MSQSTEKNKRKKWKKEMEKITGHDFQQLMNGLKKQVKIIRNQKIAIICLSVLIALSIIGGIIYGLFF